MNKIGRKVSPAWQQLLAPVAFFVLLFLVGSANASASSWSGPTTAPPEGNVSAPLNIDSVFSGDVNGTYNNLKLQIADCTSSTLFLAWNGSKWVCNDVSTTVSEINNYYSNVDGGTTINNPLAGNLLEVLGNGADAGEYSGGVIIGSTTDTFLNLGGPLTTGWLHTTQLGNNSMVGNLNLGPSTNSGISLQMEKVDSTVNLAGKYWSSIGYPTPPPFAGKELFDILAKVGTVNSTNWYDGVAGKIAFIGESNNYIPLTDIAFYSTRVSNSAPVEQMRLTASGRLGLGTSNPVGTLHLYNTSTVTNAEIDIQSIPGTGNYWGIYQAQDRSLRFWNFNTDNLLVLKNSGIVDINGSLMLEPTSTVMAGNKIYNDNGDLYWGVHKLSSVNFAGATQYSQRTTGNAGGYSGMNAKCAAAFPELANVHICSNEEILYLINNDFASLKPENKDSLWVNSGASGDANDCNGWNSDSNSPPYGTYWSLTSNPVSYKTTCDNNFQAACCY